MLDCYEHITSYNHLHVEAVSIQQLMYCKKILIYYLLTLIKSSLDLRKVKTFYNFSWFKQYIDCPFYKVFKTADYYTGRHN